SGLGRETVNAGKSRSLGAEISLAGAVTTNFTLTANYGYTYATFKEYVTNAKSADNKVIEISYNGNYVPFVPKHTLSLGG
ncbi:TonB-dependent receptor domain-containing protein, partial [Staphylococcus aureus]